MAYAGRRDEAIRAGERSVGLLPLEKDAYSGAYNRHELARVYAILGDEEKTLDQLEALLAVPYFLSSRWLTIDPTYRSSKGIRGSSGSSQAVRRWPRERRRAARSTFFGFLIRRAI